MFKNPTKTLFFISIKSLVLFSTSIYILCLPVFYFKFGMYDGLNIFGYVSPPIILQLEVLGCIILSIICMIWSFKLFYEVFKRVWKNESGKKKKNN